MCVSKVRTCLQFPFWMASSLFVSVRNCNGCKLLLPQYVPFLDGKFTYYGSEEVFVMMVMEFHPVANRTPSHNEMD